jgi:site-specific DNA recombinase
VKGWHVAVVYRLDGVSGKAVMAHPEAQRMLADLRSGAISGLVFSKLARLARSTKELLEFAEIFHACGADMISLAESIDTSTPAGRLFFTMIAAMAQWEREEIADRVKASVPIRAKLGKPIGGAPPFGYHRVDKQLVPHPEEGPVRALLYELFNEHRRMKTVARLLNERGYRTRNGSTFTDTTVTRLIRDPTAKGMHRANYTQTNDRTKSWDLKPESEWVWNTVPAIVSEDLWDRCNAFLDAAAAGRKAMARKAVHLFSGFAKCACGGPMYVWANSPKYICSTCRNKIPTGDLEAIYRDQLTSFLLSPEEIAAHRAAEIEAQREKERLLAAAESELSEIVAEENRLLQLYQADRLSMDDFGHFHRPLSERRKQLTEELPRLQAELDVLRIGLVSSEKALEEARDLSTRWEELEHEEKRQIVEAITDRIVVGKEDVEIVLLHIPSGNGADRATPSQGFMAATSWNRAG